MKCEKCGAELIHKDETAVDWEHWECPKCEHWQEEPNNPPPDDEDTEYINAQEFPDELSEDW